MPKASQIGVHLRDFTSIGVELGAFPLCSFVPFVVEGFSMKDLCFNHQIFKELAFAPALGRTPQ